MNNQAAFVGFMVTAVVGVGVGYAIRDAADGKRAPSAAAKRENVASANPAEIFKVPVGTSYQKGPSDALVTIIEFSDFQCPFCSKVTPTLDQIADKYSKDVRVVFKHQPLPFHKDAPLASEYALAAGEQGKFWQMHDKLFSNQRALKEADLKQYASELSLDQEKIDAFVASGKGKRMIAEDQKLANKIGARGTPAFFINGAKLVGAQPLATFEKAVKEAKARAQKLLSSGTPKSQLYAKLTANGRTSAPPPPPRKPPPPATRQKMELVDTTPKKGGAEPLVTIVEFSDFQCPFCSRVNPTIKQIMETYGDDVQVRFRNQPLSFHKDALPAAKAALAAGNQGKFWQMHDKLFQNQKALTSDNFERFAAELGLDVAKFQEDMKSDSIAKIVAKDQADAAKYGARGTPTSFINGMPLRGARPFADWKKTIDAEIELAKKLVAEGTPRSGIFAAVIAKEGGKPAPAAKPVAKPVPAAKLVPAAVPTAKPVAKAVEVQPAEPVEPAKPEAAAAARAPAMKELPRKIDLEELQGKNLPQLVKPKLDAPKLAKPVAALKKAEEIYKVPVGSAYTKGPADALVTIVEFSDFQCPFCGRVNPTLQQVMDTYGEDVRIAFRHQPLPFHKDAPLASEYALAAGEQGKFWQMHDKLFQNQKALKEENLKAYAAELQLDQAKIDAFIASAKGKTMIQEDQKLANSLGARGTPAFFINGAKFVGAQPFANFQKAIDAAKARAQLAVAAGTPKAEVYAKLTENGRTTAPPPPPRPAPPPATRQKLDLVDGTPAKGGNDPIVTIVEFSDFQCPFCSRVNPTLAKIIQTYGEDVQVRFRNQPLPFHKEAMPAAKAALAAGMQGKYWEMHDKLFANQKALADENLVAYAQELGLDLEKFNADRAGEPVEARIKKDQADAGKFGARGTPTLFVNGIPVRGAQPFDKFKQVIDEELKIAKTYLGQGVARKDVYAKVIADKAGEAPKPPPPPKPVEVKIGNAPTSGKADAPVKLVVFSDFQCPFCGRLNPTMEEVKKTYGDKVSVSFKHFPLGFHQDAKPAAVASLAAHRQGKFWAMHDKLFENQRALKKETFIKLAGELGMNVEQFEKDLEDPALVAQVDADMQQGSSIGVKGTPATFVNGVLLSGAQPFPKFKAAIDQALTK